MRKGKEGGRERERDREKERDRDSQTDRRTDTASMKLIEVTDRGQVSDRQTDMQGKTNTAYINMYVYCTYVSTCTCICIKQEFKPHPYMYSSYVTHLPVFPRYSYWYLTVALVILAMQSLFSQ